MNTKGDMATVVSHWNYVTVVTYQSQNSATSDERTWLKSLVRMKKYRSYKGKVGKIAAKYIKT